MFGNRVAVALTTAVAVVGALCGCQPSGTDGPEPTAGPSVTEPADSSQHESGPESPIAYGLTVPEGAVQVGPLIRFRSKALIAAYQPELQAALAAEKARKQQEVAEARENGDTIPTPEPTSPTRPHEDTFDLLDDPPKPDSTISLMRIDGKPGKVVNQMIRQIAAVLPANNIDTTDLTTYCAVKNRRYTGCRLDETGRTASGDKINIVMTVDPGNLATRTAPAASQAQPVMTVSVTYVGPPKATQEGEASGDLGDLPKAPKTKVNKEIVWPKMDLAADADTPMLDGEWTVPDDAMLLLSGNDPSFVELYADNERQADRIAHDFVASHSDAGEPLRDVVEDLNEITTTYRANSTKQGLVARATFIQSARGNYVALFFTPPT